MIVIKKEFMKAGGKTEDGHIMFLFTYTIQVLPDLE